MVIVQIYAISHIKACAVRPPVSDRKEPDTVNRFHTNALQSLVAAFVLSIGCMTVSPAAAAAASSATLKTVTATDQTATLGIPAGWTLIKSGNGFMSVKGPNDEMIGLGAIVVVVKPQQCSAGSGEVPCAMALNVSPQDKFPATIQA